ncbi:I78 family peptidase inhibitor [Oceaniglobus roseus]|uniref:I78 family peptidase inhibitor n=1 Tax=Oceaniglobus roseus TaxID=1737570 RepID=UPI00130012C2|nr:I78 family peptidase inhibitor [Kandeliimicrobium roseum]
MQTTHGISIVAAGLVLLGGCVAQNGTTPPPTGQPPAAEGGSCGASGYESLVGTNIAAVTLPDRGRDMRLIRPGDAVTMDFRETRLNIEIDDAGVIQRVYCG